MAVDATGIYFVGQTESASLPTTVGALRRNTASLCSMGFCLDDAYLAKLALDGSALTYATFLGGTTSDYATGVAVDGAGNAYVSGHTDSCNSVDYFDISGVGSSEGANALLGVNPPSCTGRPTLGTYIAANESTVPGVGPDAFVVKVNPTADAPVGYVTYLAGSSFDQANAVAVSSDGTAYVAGSTNSANFIGVPSALGAFQPAMTALNCSAGCNDDAFVARLDTTGAIAWWTYYGGDNYDMANGIAVDATSVYVVGQTQSANFPTTALPQVANMSSDAFALNFTLAGARTYGTCLGGTGNDFASSVAVIGGQAYVVGGTQSTGFPTLNPLQASLAVDPNPQNERTPQDAFVSSLSPTGTLVFSSYFGGVGYDSANGVAVSGSSIFIAGSAGGTVLTPQAR